MAAGGKVKEFVFTELSSWVTTFKETDTSKISFEESSPLAIHYPGCVDRGHKDIPHRLG